MKRKDPTNLKHPKADQSVDEPEIISLRDLQKEENTHADRTELAKSRPQVAGEQSAAGSMPNPEHVTAKTTLERAKRMGVYKKP